MQHHFALALGMPSHRIAVCEAYHDAAQAVVRGRVQALASVARAHDSFVSAAGDLAVEAVSVDLGEKAPARGCFGVARTDDALRLAMDEVLAGYLGSGEHRAMMKRFGFEDADVDLIAP